MTAKQAWNRIDDQEAERKAAANRKDMPVIAGVVDEFRKVFGSVRVSYAAENGLELGRTSNISPDGARSRSARTSHKATFEGGAK